jgi:hypothetical protein
MTRFLRSIVDYENPKPLQLEQDGLHGRPPVTFSFSPKGVTEAIETDSPRPYRRQDPGCQRIRVQKGFPTRLKRHTHSLMHSHSTMRLNPISYNLASHRESCASEMKAQKIEALGELWSRDQDQSRRPMLWLDNYLDRIKMDMTMTIDDR